MNRQKPLAQTITSDVFGQRFGERLATVRSEPHLRCVEPTILGWNEFGHVMDIKIGPGA